MRSRVRPILALVAVAALAGVGAVSGGFVASPARASEGSVPDTVVAFVSSELIPMIDDRYGRGAGGTGIDFDDSTTTGTPYRVFEFTADFLAGDADAVPVRRLNEWVTTIAVSKKPVGLATIGLDEETSGARFDAFDPDAALATALANVPDDAALVRAADLDAWFALADDTLTPLDAGASGVSTKIAIADYPDEVADPAVPEADSAVAASGNNGLIVAGIVLAIALLSVLAFALMPRRPRPPRERPTPLE